MVWMRARKTFVFARRQRLAGEQFSVTPAEAAALLYRRLASFTTAPVAGASPAAPAAPKSRRRYQRRDLQPEDE